MISRSRLKRAEAALVELRRDPRAEALAQANETVETLVAMDLLHVEVGHELPTDPGRLLEHIAALWIKHARELSVPNDGSAETRVMSLRRRVMADAIPPERAVASIVDRLAADGDGR